MSGNGPVLAALYRPEKLSHARRHHVHPGTAPWNDKADITFSDAIACVRRQLRGPTIFANTQLRQALRQTLAGHPNAAARLSQPGRVTQKIGKGRAGSVSETAIATSKQVSSAFDGRRGGRPLHREQGAAVSSPKNRSVS